MIKIAQGTTPTSATVTFALPSAALSGREHVSVVGDFNDWTPGQHSLRRRSNGNHSVAVSLPVGHTIRFRYLAEGGHWFDDTDADTIDDQGSLLAIALPPRNGYRS